MNSLLPFQRHMLTLYYTCWQMLCDVECEEVNENKSFYLVSFMYFICFFLFIVSSIFILSMVRE